MIHEKEEASPLSYQVGGDHYKRFEYQPIELIHDLGLDFDRANAVKYLARLGHKGDPLEDLEKARQYLRFYEEKQKKEREQIQRFVDQLDTIPSMVAKAVCFGALDAAFAMLGSLEAQYMTKKMNNE